MDDHLEGSAAAEVIAIDGEGDVPGWVREEDFTAAEEDGVLFAVALAELEAEVLVLHVDGRAAEVDVARHEDRLGVGVAEGLKEFVVGEEFEGEEGEGDFGVDPEFGAALFGLGGAEDEFREVGAEGVHAAFFDGESCGHVVAAAGEEVGAAGVDGFDEGDAFDGAA